MTGAHRLGVERSRLLNMPLTAFVATGESPRLFEHLRKTFEQTEKRAAEVTIRPRNGPPMDSHLESVAMTSADGTVVCRTALIDITDLKQAQQAGGRARSAVSRCDRDQFRWFPGHR